MENDPGPESRQEYLKRLINAIGVRPVKSGLEHTEQARSLVYMTTTGVIAGLLEREVEEATLINDRLKLLQQEENSLEVDLWQVAHSFEAEQPATSDRELRRENKSLAAIALAGHGIALIQTARQLEETEELTIDTSQLFPYCTEMVLDAKPDVSTETYKALGDLLEEALLPSGPPQTSN